MVIVVSSAVASAVWQPVRARALTPMMPKARSGERRMFGVLPRDAPGISRTPVCKLAKVTGNYETGGLEISAEVNSWGGEGVANFVHEHVPLLVPLWHGHHTHPV